MTAHHAYPDVSWSDLRAEIQRELMHRRETFPRLVAKGQLLAAEADRELALFAAMLEDCDRWQQAAPRLRRAAPARHGLTWQDRWAALNRALEARARNWPQRISKGQLTQADADRHTRRLMALRALYEQGLDWHASDGHAPRMWPPEGGTDQDRAARFEWYTLQARIHDRDGNTPMRDAMARAADFIHPEAGQAIREMFMQQEELAL